MGGDVSWLNRPLQLWFREATLRPYPIPPKLDCKSCTRSKSAQSPEEKRRWQNWKCCTFQPFVPNYLLGSMLETKPLPKNDRNQFALSALGLCPTAEYRGRFFAKADEQRGEDLICAFYDREHNTCGNWKNRPSECANYFCESTSFFRSRSQDLFDWEMAVAQMALVEHGFNAEEIENLMGWMDWNDEETLHQSWAHYRGKEVEFFESCWRWAQTLKARDIRSWLPEEAQARFDSWVRFA